MNFTDIEENVQPKVERSKKTTNKTKTFAKHMVLVSASKATHPEWLKKKTKDAKRELA